MPSSVVWCTPLLVSLSLLVSLVTASAPSVVSLGSSYALGNGLYKSYGEILATFLANGEPANYTALAVSGSNVTDVTVNQARKLAGKHWDVVVLTSGGNDLNYVACLGSPTLNYCGKTINRSTYIARFTAALDTIFANLAEPTKVPVYVVGYTQALGIWPDCSPKTVDCPLNATQVATSETTYDHIVSWTSSAVATWKAQNSRKGYTVRLIPMNVYSANQHDFDSSVPWINGAISGASTGNGAAWHPNAAGAQFMAQAVYQDLQWGQYS